jgi:hypothetical protein
VLRLLVNHGAVVTSCAVQIAGASGVGAVAEVLRGYVKGKEEGVANRGGECLDGTMGLANGDEKAPSSTTSISTEEHKEKLE